MLSWTCIYRVVRCGLFMGVLNTIVFGGGGGVIHWMKIYMYVMVQVANIENLIKKLFRFQYFFLKNLILFVEDKV